MNLVWLFFVLALFGFAFAKLEPLLVMPVIAPLALFKSRKNPLLYLFGAVGWLWQIYVVLAWCVVAVLATQLFLSRPSVEHRWMYYMLGFFGCLAPVQFMLSFDREPRTVRSIQQLATLLLTAGGFIAFTFSPVLTAPWAWMVRLVAK